MNIVAYILADVLKSIRGQCEALNNRTALILHPILLNRVKKKKMLTIMKINILCYKCERHSDIGWYEAIK